MTAVPADTPPAMPVASPIVATAVLLLVHVPPPASVRVELVPTQNDETPEIGLGNGFTVTVVVIRQPVGRVYVITDVPVETPETIPVVDPTVATVVLLLSQVPPPASDNVVVLPTQTFVVPVMGLGSGFTVIVVVTAQLAPME